MTRKHIVIFYAPKLITERDCHRMIISIASGKGAGKTSFTAAFASLAKNKVLCDVDIDADDFNLLTDLKIKERHDFQGSTAFRL